MPSQTLLRIEPLSTAHTHPTRPLTHSAYFQPHSRHPSITPPQQRHTTTTTSWLSQLSRANKKSHKNTTSRPNGEHDPPSVSLVCPISHAFQLCCVLHIQRVVLSLQCDVGQLRVALRQHSSGLWVLRVQQSTHTGVLCPHTRGYPQVRHRRRHSECQPIGIQERRRVGKEPCCWSTQKEWRPTVSRDRSGRYYHYQQR